MPPSYSRILPGRISTPVIFIAHTRYTRMERAAGISRYAGHRSAPLAARAAKGKSGRFGDHAPRALVTEPDQNDEQHKADPRGIGRIALPDYRQRFVAAAAGDNAGIDDPEQAFTDDHPGRGEHAHTV